MLGERGARYFVGRFTLGLDEAAAVFGRNDDLGINLQERDSRIIYVLHIAVNRFFSSKAAGTKCHAAKGGSRLSGVRGERLSGRFMERRARRQETPWSGVRSGAERVPVFCTSSARQILPTPSTIIRCADVKLWLLYCCNALQ